jgi:hypothetical protein
MIPSPLRPSSLPRRPSPGTRWAGMLLLTGMGMAVAGCGSDGGPVSGSGPGPDPAGAPAGVAAVGSPSFGGTVGLPLSTPVRVRVVNAGGQGVAGISVAWEVTSGGGILEAEGSPSTDASGEARARWTLGTGAGIQGARATVVGLPPVTFSADARADVPASLAVESSGAERITTLGSAFAEPIRFRVEDRHGNPAAGQAIQVQVVAGGGWVTDDAPRTDARGEATVTWYAGSDPSGGDQRLRLEAGPSDALRLDLEGRALPPEVGVRLAGHRSFVEYTPGTLPLVITAAHGGTVLPTDLPDRTWGTLVRDLATDTLALLVADSLEALTGERPHLVRVHLHRRKLDANRDLDEAAQGNAEAIRAWREFHAWTEAAMATVRASHARGLYLDVHGHGHDVQRLELGYLLSASDLALGDAALNEPELAARSSLRELASWTGRTPAEVVRGPGSPGDRFHRLGYPAVPSPQDPHPGGAPYFSGGYNTRRYGCSEGGPICGFQLEANRIGVRDSGPALGAFGGVTARVLLEMLADIAAAPPPPPGGPATGHPSGPDPVPR